MSDDWRPRVHFTPERHWINDPNGLIWHDGEYHLFYQYNPHGDQWGHMSWGHAISADMLRWRELPMAIPETDDRMAYSGSTVIDVEPTSGLGEAPAVPMVAVYTGAPTLASLAAPRGGWSALGTARRRTGVSRHADRIRDQRLAWSTDRGRSWTLVGESVLDIGSTAFRDPKVFFHDATRRWVMLVSHADEGKLAFHASHDLKSWTRLSDWSIEVVPAGQVWEWPDLMRVPIDRQEAGPDATAWVIKVDR